MVLEVAEPFVINVLHFFTPLILFTSSTLTKKRIPFCFTVNARDSPQRIHRALCEHIVAYT